MPFRIAKSFTIESGHVLSKHPGNCRFPHGHSRRIEIVLASDALDAADMVCDFKALKEAVGALIAPWDHALCLNTTDPQFAYLKQTYAERVVAFENEDPTSEVLARRLFQAVQARLAVIVRVEGGPYPIRPTVRVERVRVTETATSWAEYCE
jgi:6-pyruvoyltetrahydropterin/6-carboxytetrahydropterin synthase